MFFVLRLSLVWFEINISFSLFFGLIFALSAKETSIKANFDFILHLWLVFVRIWVFHLRSKRPMGKTFFRYGKSRWKFAQGATNVDTTFHKHVKFWKKNWEKKTDSIILMLLLRDVLYKVVNNIVAKLKKLFMTKSIFFCWRGGCLSFVLRKYTISDSI